MDGKMVDARGLACLGQLQECQQIIGGEGWLALR